MKKSLLCRPVPGDSKGVVGAIPVQEIEVRPPFGLVIAREYVLQHPESWSSWESLRWFLRRHRAALAAAEAVYSWRGYLCLDPEKFEAEAKRIMRISAES